MQRKIPLIFSTLLLFACTQQQSQHPLTFQQIPLEGPVIRGLTDFKFLPGGQEFLAMNRGGTVHRYRLRGNRAEFLGEFQIPNVFNQGDCAANALQLDPDFAENGYFYIGYCTDMQSSLITRYTYNAEFFHNIPASAKEIIRVGDPLATKPQHAVDTMTFDASKAMLVSLGDKGRPENARDLGSRLGKILRLIPGRDPDGEGYEVPSDNPFVDVPGADPLVYAYGLRNPWRTVMDGDGRYWIGDVGAAKFEEINLLSEPGQNFGWPAAEGLCQKNCDGLTDPLVTYTHTKDDPFILEDPMATSPVSFRAMWIGMRYSPVRADRYEGLLTDRLLFGDFYMGWIRGMHVTPEGSDGRSTPLGHLSTVVSMQQGPDDYVYAATLFSQSYAFNDAELTPADNGGLWRMVLSDSEEEEYL